MRIIGLLLGVIPMLLRSKVSDILRNRRVAWPLFSRLIRSSGTLSFISSHELGLGTSIVVPPVRSDWVLSLGVVLLVEFRLRLSLSLISPISVHGSSRLR